MSSYATLKRPLNDRRRASCQHKGITFRTRAVYIFMYEQYMRGMTVQDLKAFWCVVSERETLRRIHLGKTYANQQPR